MKMDKDQARDALFKAMMEHDGNRVAAAKSLKISVRTFYRYIDEYELGPVFDRAGWARPGPPRGGNDALLPARAAILVAIHKGVVDYGSIAKLVYGQDTPSIRGKVFKALESLVKEGRVKEINGEWKLT